MGVRVGARVRIGYNLRKDGQDIGGARRRSGGSRAWAVRESNRKDRKGTERERHESSSLDHADRPPNKLDRPVSLRTPDGPRLVGIHQLHSHPCAPPSGVCVRCRRRRCSSRKRRSTQVRTCCRHTRLRRSILPRLLSNLVI